MGKLVLLNAVSLKGALCKNLSTMLHEDFLHCYYYPGKQQSKQDRAYWQPLLTKHNCVTRALTRERLRAPTLPSRTVEAGVVGTWSKGQQMRRANRGMQVFCSREGKVSVHWDRLCGGAEVCGTREIWKE